MDDRVCMHYVLDRIETIMRLHDPNDAEIADMEYMYDALGDLKDEFIYNLGVNQRIQYKDGDLK